MNKKNEKVEISLKNRRQLFSINIRKKQNQKFFRESRRALVEKRDKIIKDNKEEENILGNLKSQINLKPLNPK